jgi:hypothetical protein
MPAQDYSEFVWRKKREYGDRFSAADLDQRFVPFFESGARIRIAEGSEEVTGTIGATTGPKPAFLLMRRSSDMDSEIVLGPRTKILAVQRNGRYVRYIG